MNRKISTIIALAVIAVSCMVIIITLAGRNGNSGNVGANSSSNAATVTTTATANTVSSTPTATPEVSQEVKDNVAAIKTYLMENGFEEEEGVYYTGYNYGEWLYCSITYDKEADILCLKNSYYTGDGAGDFYEMLAVWDNFPYSSTVFYCENHYGTAEGDESQANSLGTAVFWGTFNPKELTAESELTLVKSEESSYEIADMNAVLKNATDYTVTSFSYWDEIIEWTFELNLKDFGLTNFVRQ